jgi:hypothetical protein
MKIGDKVKPDYDNSPLQAPHAKITIGIITEHVKYEDEENVWLVKWPDLEYAVPHPENFLIKVK